MLNVDFERVRAALDHAETARASAGCGQLANAASIGSSAVAGGELAAALTEVGPALDARVRALGHALEAWTEEVAAAVAAYQGVDDQSRAALDRLAWEAV